MVYNTQNYWVFGLFSIVRYSRDYRTRRLGNWICFHPRMKGKTPTQLGPLERANLGTLVQYAFALPFARAIVEVKGTPHQRRRNYRTPLDYSGRAA
jgi:hypothetical protein